MKLDQIYFRQGHFPEAATQFETLASETPDSPLAETALFLAGQSADENDGGNELWAGN